MKDQIIKYFTALCDIYRPSHKEIAASNYLLKWFKDLKKKDPRIKISTFQGLKTNNLEGFDIIVDIPATKGYEKKPRTILQSHIDMVWVTRDGHLNDKKVHWYIKDDKMRAKYSSLGADDGIGVAIIQYIVKDSKTPHGPIRVILTKDEEEDMSGAVYLPAKYCKDCKYCFNIDGEVEGEGYVMSAGVRVAKARLEIKLCPKPKQYAIPIYIKTTGGKGGHSGIEMARTVTDLKKDAGRANCLWWTNRLLLNLIKAKVDYKISIISHGKILIEKNTVYTNSNKINAIPDNGDAIIYVKTPKDVAAVKKIAKETQAELHHKHPHDTQIKIEAITDKIPDSINDLMVFKDGEKEKLLKTLSLIPQGVFEMSNFPGIPISTSCVTLNFKYNRGAKVIDYYLAGMPRSSKNANVEKLKEQIKKLYVGLKLKEEKDKRATELNTKNTYFIHETACAWSMDPKNHFCKLVAKAWKKRNKKPFEYKAIHGGLECGYFYKANPKLLILCLGPTMYNVHSVDEVLHLDTITSQAQLMIDSLEMIAKQ